MDGDLASCTHATDLTGALAERTAGLGFDDLPAPVCELARQCVLDYLGCAVAGAGDPLVRLLLDEVAEAGGTPQASGIGLDLFKDRDRVRFSVLLQRKLFFLETGNVGARLIVYDRGN